MTVSARRTTAGSRKRGGPRRIDRAGIVEAAKRLDPQGLTMQAVADELGVDRKALNYHISSRDGLLKLLAADAFGSTLAQTRIPSDVGWEEAVVLFSRGVRDAVYATGSLADYHRIGAELSILEPAAVVLDSLVAAGLTGRDAAGVIQHITLLAMGMGRDLVLQAPDDAHPQMTQLLTALGEEPPDGDRFTLFRSAVKTTPITFGEAHFDFEMQLVHAAVNALLEGSRATAPAGHDRRGSST